MKVLVPLAGPDREFEERYSLSKSLTEIGQRPLIEHVYENLATIPNAEFVFVVRRSEVRSYHIDSVLRLLAPACRIVVAERPTAGAACTALLAVEEIDPEGPLVITNGDQLILNDLAKIVADFQQRNLDGGIITFPAVHPRWSYVRLDDEGHVVEAAEKRPISRNATAGFYYFRRAADFLEGARQMILKEASVNNAFFVCPVYNELILRQQRIGVYQIERDQYISLSSPRGLEHYEDLAKSFRAT